ncbi:MAG: flagellar protein FliT [Lachnospiraceae bacterium]|nr:flagellar protein FliT [Lachnospiraceae bacterium]
MMTSYLQILQDSLIKKYELLCKIEAKSLEQSHMLKSQNVEMSQVDFNMDEKAKLIEEVLSLDNGFESIYEKIRTELLPNKEQYKTQIVTLQKLIGKVTEKSTSIQAIEARNKAQMDIFFSNQKKELQGKRNAMSVARDYYQNMNKVKHVSPQFLDQKK